MSEADVGLSERPDGWVWTTLEEISKINPRIDKQSIGDDLEITFLPMKNVEELSGKIDLSETKRFSEVKKKSYTPFRDGDILFAKVTPCMENGKIAIAHGLKNGIGFGSTEFHVIRLPEKLSTPFFFFYLIQQKFRQEAQRAMTSAVGLLRVPTHYMRQTPIPLPPFPEQQRIVAKIEGLFTKLDAGIDALRKVSAQLKRYRQSVLKAAFEGKLTEAWRAEHQEEIEFASQAADDLPEGWKWTTLEEVVHIIDYRGRTPPYSSEGIPHLRSSNIRNGNIIWNDLKYVTEETYGNYMTRGLPEQGDLLFTTEAPLGEVAFAPKKRFSLAQRIMILRPSKHILDSGFLLYQIRTISFQERLRISETGSVVRGISSRNFKQFSLIVPPLPEQQAIVYEVKRCLSVADDVEKTVATELKRAEQLRQSILKKAFSGGLAPQDPNDEPASVLLERVRAEKS